MRTKWLGMVCILFIAPIGLGTTGCATQDSETALEKRVATLEEKQKALEDAGKAKDAEEQERQSRLERCVNVEANEAYWDYIKLNGKPVAGKPGVYNAAMFVWDAAEKRKKEKVEECKLLYGPRQ